MLRTVHLAQIKNSFRRGLFHPDDIKVLGLSGSPGPSSAPLPGLSRKASRPSLNLVNASGGGSFGPPPTRSGHSRTSSVTPGSVANGSFGRSDARRNNSPSEFDKYTEDDEEDYDDVFGKPNSNSK